MYKVYLSDSYNPYFNLAFEEYLVRHASQRDRILFLWQNQNTIVIGRNQNPWKECNLQELECQGGKLVRRLSGGGAVYHDLGNLNFTFISTYSEHKIEENIGLIIKALKLNEIDAVFSGKNDILVDGNKVSGSAFFAEEDILCHHGTLLADTDLEKLSCFLTVSKHKLQSKGIDSVKSRVRNLKTINGRITIESLKTALLHTFAPEDGKIAAYRVNEDATNDDLIDSKSILELMKRFESWEWNFGSSPEFNLQINERFHWGEIHLYLLVKDGFIMQTEVSTDALDVNLPQKIKVLMQNRKFDYDEVLSLLNQL